MKFQFKIVLTLLAVFIIPVISGASNIVRTVSVSVSAGGNCTLQVQIDNTDAFVAFQVDIPIPAGFTYVDESAQLNSSRSSGHVLSANLLGSTLRLIAYSVSNAAFKGSSGTLITFNLNAGSIPGNYSIVLNNAMLSNSQSQSLSYSTQNGAVTILGPNIQSSAISLDFGRVALNASNIKVVTIQNTGNQNLVINGFSFTDGQFTLTVSEGFTLASGQSRQISVLFAPTIKGTYNKQMRILSNDPDTPETVITLNAIGFAVNELRAGSVVGASGTVKKLEFTINNMETFIGFQFDIILPSPMSYVPGSEALSRQQDQIIQTNMINSTTLRVVAFSVSGKSFNGSTGKILTIDFNLNGAGGNYPITLGGVLIADNSGDNVVSAWYGNTLQITAPDIAASTSVSFGDVSILSEGHQNLIVYNYGQENLVINQLIFDSSYFTSSQNLPVTILPGKNQVIPLCISKNVKGSATGKLQILSNDPDEYPFVVSLTGNAYVPNYILVNEYSVVQDSTFQLLVEVNNEESFVALQFDLEFPTGLMPDLNAIALTSRKQDHALASSLIDSNHLRIIAYSPVQKAFTGNTGAMVTIPFTSAASMTPGTYSINLSNGVLSNAQSENILYGMQNGIVKITTKNIIVTQNMNLNTGWNIFSATVTPQNCDMKEIFMPLIIDGSLVKIQDETGNALEDLGLFGGWVNKIGNSGCISPQEGYKVKVTRNCQLSITGLLAPMPFQIPMNAGWNIIGYPKQTEAEAKAVVQQLIDRHTLIKVQDETGKAIEDYGLLGGWQNNIGNFKPGEGYKIKVNTSDILTIY
jgi:hypothetical protein